MHYLGSQMLVNYESLIKMQNNFLFNCHSHAMWLGHVTAIYHKKNSYIYIYKVPTVSQFKK